VAQAHVKAVIRALGCEGSAGTYLQKQGGGAESQEARQQHSLLQRVVGAVPSSYEGQLPLPAAPIEYSLGISIPARPHCTLEALETPGTQLYQAPKLLRPRPCQGTKRMCSGRRTGQWCVRRGRTTRAGPDGEPRPLCRPPPSATLYHGLLPCDAACRCRSRRARWDIRRAGRERLGVRDAEGPDSTGVSMTTRLHTHAFRAPQHGFSTRHTHRTLPPRCSHTPISYRPWACSLISRSLGGVVERLAISFLLVQTRSHGLHRCEGCRLLRKHGREQ
jgi:hypothetical protein